MKKITSAVVAMVLVGSVGWAQDEDSDTVVNAISDFTGRDRRGRTAIPTRTRRGNRFGKRRERRWKMRSRKFLILDFGFQKLESKKGGERKL